MVTEEGPLPLVLLLLACVGADPTGAHPAATAPPAFAAPAAQAAASAAAPAEPAAPWPAPTAPLTVLPTPRVAGTLLLDAGHGAPGNPGNSNWRCEAEQDVMRRVTDGVASALTAGGVPVRRTRPDDALVHYDDRLAMSRDATWLVSLHADSRAGEGLHADPATGCWTNTGATGFTVLWSDEGAAPLVDARRALARAIARRLAQAGFAPYSGVDYPGLYDGDVVPGVFVDRHAPKQRIRLLRRPTVPSVIVETHQSWDRAEATRWDAPATWTAFAAALATALADVEQAPAAAR